MTDVAALSPPEPTIRRLTVIAEHLDPQLDLSALAGLTLIRALVESGVEVTLHCGVCPAWASPPGVSIEQMGVVPWVTHRLIRWHRAMSRVANAGDGAGGEPVLSLTPMVRGDVTLLLSGTERGRLIHLADPVGAGAMATLRRCIALARPAALLRTQYEKRAISGSVKRSEASAGAAVSANTVATLSELAAEEARALRDAHADPPVVLPMAVGRPSGDADQVAAQRVALRRGLGIAADESIILFPAARPLTHGFGPLMLALRHLRDQGRPVVVLLAGRYRYTHLSWVAELGVRDAVRFVGPTQRLEVLYQAADVVAHPTYYDPGGMAVLLALAAGKAVVTSGACAAAGLLSPLESEAYAAVLDTLASPQALAGALDAALEAVLDPAGRDRAGAELGVLARPLDPLKQARAVLAELEKVKSPPPLALGAGSD